ncbi:MAG: aldolase/citrate lyase family protein [Treponema sp.]|nr:aldolase/citrate lyase family protein [Treponema sp.]
MSGLSVKERAMGGEKVCGTMIRNVRSPAMMHIAKNAGLDFIMFDCEHFSLNMETLHDSFLLANAIGLEGWARVPVTTKDYISRFLDAGATGIMAPMTETVEQAKQLVYWSKYEPVGGRGFTANGAHTGYKTVSHKELMTDSNRRVMSIAQIETKLAVENAKAIASVEGIDCLLIGPNDLSIALGIPGDIMNPIELEAIAKVAKACRETGKLFSIHSPSSLHDKFKNELNIVMQIGDTEMLRSGCEGIRAYCDKLKKEASHG